MLVIGHGGASAVAPANTLLSFDAALEAGADMIEFDVRSRRGGLILAHGLLAPRRRDTLTLDGALQHLGGPAFARMGLNVDVKASGHEEQVIAKLRAYGLTDRALVSSQSTVVIDRIRRLEPGLATAISISGRAAWHLRTFSLRDWRTSIAGALRNGRFGDVMLEQSLIDPEVVASLSEAGRRVFAWTVDDEQRCAALTDAGVAGVVTGDPGRLRIHFDGADPS